MSSRIIGIEFGLHQIYNRFLTSHHIFSLFTNPENNCDFILYLTSDKLHNQRKKKNLGKFSCELLYYTL